LPAHLEKRGDIQFKVVKKVVVYCNCIILSLQQDSFRFLYTAKSPFMTSVKIFLASSEELKVDRNAFEVFINQENKVWKDRNIFFELNIWEDFLDALSPKRLQDEYNKVIKGSDIFVLLFHTR
jgi:hypothetical protein